MKEELKDIIKTIEPKFKEEYIWDKDGDRVLIKMWYNPYKHEWTPIKNWAIKGHIWNNLSPLIEEILSE